MTKQSFCLIIALSGLIFASSGIQAMQEKPVPAPTPATAPQEAEEAPEPIVRVAPLYPARAVRNRIEGYVDLRFRIDKAGQPKDIEVVESSPAGVVDRAVIRAVEQWRYEPIEHAEVTMRIDMKLGNE
ncbi:MAG: TonB receptor energy transduction system periplasmic component TonB2 [Idiomarinaceae bacterium HL-53]|nr:MAG: TonB receptor energy transduction system periplasmic component TonB2 [Idiomarinaceae bacterium HL-53]CUS48017.1 TonB family C-terminal domain-containing protein [Idiomarinaceae bacterium HL-53]